MTHMTPPPLDPPLRLQAAQGSTVPPAARTHTVMGGSEQEFGFGLGGHDPWDPRNRPLPLTCSPRRPTRMASPAERTPVSPLMFNDADEGGAGAVAAGGHQGEVAPQLAGPKRPRAQTAAVERDGDRLRAEDGAHPLLRTAEQPTPTSPCSRADSVSTMSFQTAHIQHKFRPEGRVVFAGACTRVCVLNGFNS